MNKAKNKITITANILTTLGILGGLLFLAGKIIGAFRAIF